MDKYFEPINKLYLSQPFAKRGDEGELDRCLHIAETYAFAEKMPLYLWVIPPGTAATVFLVD